MSSRDGVCGGIIPKVRSELASRLDKELSLSCTEIALSLSISTAGVSRIIAKRQSKPTQSTTSPTSQTWSRVPACGWERREWCEGTAFL